MVFRELSHPPGGRRRCSTPLEHSPGSCRPQEPGHCPVPRPPSAPRSFGGASRRPSSATSTKTSPRTSASATRCSKPPTSSRASSSTAPSSPPSPRFGLAGHPHRPDLRQRPLPARRLRPPVRAPPAQRTRHRPPHGRPQGPGRRVRRRHQPLRRGHRPLPPDPGGPRRKLQATRSSPRRPPCRSTSSSPTRCCTTRSTAAAAASPTSMRPDRRHLGTATSSRSRTRPPSDVLRQRLRRRGRQPALHHRQGRAPCEIYREHVHTAAAGKYALSAPFCERFFQLARDGGFVGQITANSFMKREFGKKLIEEFLPTVNLDGIVNTSGAYIPGHGTPTVMLFGTQAPPAGTSVRRARQARRTDDPRGSGQGPGVVEHRRDHWARGRVRERVRDRRRGRARDCWRSTLGAWGAAARRS